MILISAGHSNTDPGATGFGYTEAQIVTEFRNLVSKYLTAAGVEHTTDGTGDINLPLREAAAMAKKATVAIEFHCNAGPEKASGVETLSAEKDFALGRSICDVISKVLDIPNRGAKPENSGQHSRLAFVQAGGIIVELFFISNFTDLHTYLERKDELAQVLAYAIEKHI